MGWLGDGSHRGQVRYAWTAVGLPHCRRGTPNKTKVGLVRGPFLHRHQGNSTLKQHYYCHYYKILFEVWRIHIAVQKLWSVPVVNGKTSAKQNKIKTLRAETETNIYEQTSSRQLRPDKACKHLSRYLNIWRASLFSGPWASIDYILCHCMRIFLRML